jgi:hypothetical protein
MQRAYPRYYLDFETIQFAVPIWAGTRPYEQLPFQWSCTIEHANATTEHREFLDTTGYAPMLACARALVGALGSDGPVFAYSGFEGRILRESAARYLELVPALHAIAARSASHCPLAFLPSGAERLVVAISSFRFIARWDAKALKSRIEFGVPDD